MTSFTQWLDTAITNIENAVKTTEADVQVWVAKIQSGFGVIEADLAYGLKWIAAEAPTIITDMQGALALAQAIPGLQIPAAAIEATTAAAAALTAVAAAENAGKSTGQTLVSAYNAVVQAKSATAGVLSAVTTAPTPSAPAVPAA